MVLCSLTSSHVPPRGPVACQQRLLFLTSKHSNWLQWFPAPLHSQCLICHCFSLLSSINMLSPSSSVSAVAAESRKQCGAITQPVWHLSIAMLHCNFILEKPPSHQFNLYCFQWRVLVPQGLCCRHPSPSSPLSYFHLSCHPLALKSTTSAAAFPLNSCFTPISFLCLSNLPPTPLCAAPSIITSQQQCGVDTAGTAVHSFCNVTPLSVLLSNYCAGTPRPCSFKALTLDDKN